MQRPGAAPPARGMDPQHRRLRIIETIEHYRIPESINHALEPRDAWPWRSRATEDEILRLEGPGPHDHVWRMLDGLRGDLMLAREDFMYAIGVAVGMMLAEGRQEPDEMEAETIVAAARRTQDLHAAERLARDATYQSRFGPLAEWESTHGA
jgi:hypothetical protein